MVAPVHVLLGLLGAAAAGYALYWVRRLESFTTTVTATLIGFGTNFFDALGIGNFAPTTALFRGLRLVADEKIPGTMNVGHTLPVVLMGFLFIDGVRVEATTLITLIAAAIVGAWLGAGIVTGLPRRAIQVGMGIALLVVAGFLIESQFAAGPEDVGDLGLAPATLALAAVVLAVLGALMMIGVGLYAPCMALITLLGMNPKAAFPIMMGACAFLMPVASVRFIAARRYDRRAALGLTIGGLPAVVVAVVIVQSLEVYTLKWLVIAVVVATAILMLAGAGGRRDPVAPASPDA